MEPIETGLMARVGGAGARFAVELVDDGVLIVE